MSDKAIVFSWVVKQNIASLQHFVIMTKTEDETRIETIPQDRLSKACCSEPQVGKISFSPQVERCNIIKRSY